jgi:two-component system phosphate regulon sensor histidine kinase PhoR
MSRKRMLWQIFPSYVIIMAIVAIWVAWYGSWSFRNSYLSQVSSDLRARAALIENQILQSYQDDSDMTIDLLCKEIGNKSNTRISVIHSSGAVLGDSDHDSNKMENHGNRPEIVDALNLGSGQATRFSNTLQKSMMYIAIKSIVDNDSLVIRTSIPLTDINETIWLNNVRIAIAGLFIIFLAAVASLLVSRRISYPLEQIQIGAKRFASGDLTKALPVPNLAEVGALSESMNHMARELKTRIDTITRQKQEHEAILGSMIEGVLAVDQDECLINCNEVAINLLNLNDKILKGKTIYEVIRHVGLQKLIANTLENQKQLQEELVFGEQNERLVLTSTMRLHDFGGNTIGVLVVFHDITNLRKLENIKKDFVANVSHELKTPITSIKGSIETLMDGAYNNKEDAEKFLNIAAMQTDRLHHIIEDLLSLSRIENEIETEKITTESENILRLIRQATNELKTSINAENIEFDIRCSEDLTANINGPLISQAVGNFIDNAIKYGRENGKIVVSAEIKNNQLFISVEDNGPGIDPEHHDRLFERFYRIDKSRSSSLGGTGLGLAIVKHVALAHGGQVSVDSSPGKGSVFSIIIPE